MSSDVLLLPALTENVVFAIRKATHAPRRSATGARKEGRIITVFSPKGGTGKTVIATNLAAALSKAGDRRTLLLDLDLQFGDAAIMLGIEPEKTIFDFVNAPGELDSGQARRLHDEAQVGSRHPAGTAPPRRRGARDRGEARPADRGRTRNLRRDRRRHLAVLPRPDAGDARPHGRVLLLVCSLDVPTLKNVRLALGTLEMLSFPPARDPRRAEPREQQGRA